MKKQKTDRHTDFAKNVYKILRDYQEDKVPMTQISVGVLSSKLTVVFDRILEAAAKEQESV